MFRTASEITLRGSPLRDPDEATLEGSHLFPLKDPDEIRLLCLEPRSQGEIIRCTTEHALLSRRPYYEALSYEWGSKETKTITLNGKDHDIRQNLFDALDSLRRVGMVRCLWVDAICINQKDLEERNHQVSQMASIYSQAESVIIWLRQPELGCERTLRFLQDAPLSEIEQTRRSIFRWDEDTEVLTGVQFLAGKPYWARLWVIQEVALATNVQVQCGAYCVPWASLKYLCHHLQSKSRVLATSRMLVFAAGHPNARTMNLSYLCWMHSKAQCENDLDRVFGLWALASECCQQAIPVDYSLTLEQVLQKLLIHDVAAHGVLEASAEDVYAYIYAS